MGREERAEGFPPYELERSQRLPRLRGPMSWKGNSDSGVPQPLMLALHLSDDICQTCSEHSDLTSCGFVRLVSIVGGTTNAERAKN